MSFENPAGLWLLLGVPVLIIIWLIRPRHEQRQVSSSYIWQLSDRFMKNRLPLSGMGKRLLFVLQLLMIIGFSLIAARPVLLNGPRICYVAIVDHSASMRMTNADGRTCLDTALDLVQEKAAETEKGHLFSVILAGENARWCVREAESKEAVTAALSRLQAGYSGDSLAQALTMAQQYAQEHPGTRILLYTDQQTRGIAEGVTVISVRDASGWNAALTGMTVTPNAAGRYTVSGTAVSTGRDAVLTIGLRVNGVLRGVQSIDCKNGVPRQAVFLVEGAGRIREAELYMQPGDDLMEDDRFIVCPAEEYPCDTLLVTDEPLYLQGALEALRRGRVTVIGTAEYRDQTGYQLYIFDRVMPEQLPEEGSVLLIDPDRLPEGMTRQKKQVTPAGAVMAVNGSRLQGRVLKEMQLREISVSVYQPVLASARWESMLTCAGSPVLLSRLSENGSAVTVLLFDLHDSNLPLLTDLLILLRNCMDLAVPGLTDTAGVVVGDTVPVAPARGQSTLTVTAPDGEEFVYTAAGSLHVSVPGVYHLRSGSMTAAVAARIPAEESVPAVMEAPVVALPDAETDAEQAVSGLWALLAGILLILLLAEWRIDSHEQA